MARNNLESIIKKGFASQTVATIFFEITPHDTNKLTDKPRAIYIGSSGNLVVEDGNRNEVTFNNLPAGIILPIEPELVKATNTTAGNLIGLK